MSSPVVTRFAPSPTGFLHIGGGRTALFNWLYAKAKGGKMLLRIEDTDRERSTDAAIAAILDGLAWLGLDWEGAPISQFARAARHREVAEQMLANGKAYYCYATPQELEEMRETARSEGRPPHYDRRWRDRDPATAPSDVKPVIRLRSPIEGETVIHDEVQGTVRWANKDLDDRVLLRSDGTPTYMLAVVVDDHDMGVTHIIRGDDHLTNAASQKQIYDAMGWDVPHMAHIPLIHGPDGAKLSKRHGALGVDAYRALGYLPAAMRNYLVRLSWSHGDQEVFSTDEMIRYFDTSAIGKSAARFDFKKLENLNGLYMRNATSEDLLAAIDQWVPHISEVAAVASQVEEAKRPQLLSVANQLKAHIPEGAARLNDAKRAQLLAAIPSLKERAKTLIELLDGANFLFVSRPLPLDAKAAAMLNTEARATIAMLLPRFEALGEWTAAATESVVRTAAEEAGIKLGNLAQPLRAALTGRTTSPPVFDVLAVLGREESLARLRDQT